LGVERTTFGGKLHLCLRRSDLLKISRRYRLAKMLWGKHWGIQLKGLQVTAPLPQARRSRHVLVHQPASRQLTSASVKQRPRTLSIAPTRSKKTARNGLTPLRALLPQADHPC
jgi:hypothetical protein